jgi:hypothetical protein
MVELSWLFSHVECDLERGLLNSRPRGTFDLQVSGKPTSRNKRESFLTPTRTLPYKGPRYSILNDQALVEQSSNVHICRAQ